MVEYSGLLAPDVVADELDEERVSGGCLACDAERIRGDNVAARFDRLADCLGDIVDVHRAEHMTIGPTQERDCLVRQETLLHRTREAGRRKRNLATLSDEVLQHRCKLAQLNFGCSVNLVDR